MYRAKEAGGNTVRFYDTNSHMAFKVIQDV